MVIYSSRIYSVKDIVDRFCSRLCNDYYEYTDIHTYRSGTMREMEKGERQQQSRWFIGFCLTDTDNVTARQLVNSDALKGVLAAAYENEYGNVHLVISVRADESQQAMGRATEQLWSLLEAEKVSGLVTRVVLNAGEGILIDGTGTYYALDAARGAFHDPDSLA